MTVGRRCQRHSIWRRPLAELNENKMASFVNVRIKAKVKTLSPSNLLDSDQTVYYRGGENILLSGTTTETRNKTTAKTILSFDIHRRDREPSPRCGNGGVFVRSKLAATIPIFLTVCRRAASTWPGKRRRGPAPARTGSRQRELHRVAPT